MKPKLLIIAILLFSFASCKNFRSANNVSHDTIKQPEGPVSKQDSIRNIIAEKYNIGLAKLDSLAGENIRVANQFPKQSSEIDSIKSELKLELKKTNFDFDKANTLATEFNNKIDALISDLKKNKK